MQLPTGNIHIPRLLCTIQHLELTTELIGMRSLYTGFRT